MSVFIGNRFGNRLLFASIEINTTMVPTRIGHVEGLKVYNHWENFMNKKVSIIWYIRFISPSSYSVLSLAKSNSAIIDHVFQNDSLFLVNNFLSYMTTLFNV
jgi:hypothetical protein